MIPRWAGLTTCKSLVSTVKGMFYPPGYLSDFSSNRRRVTSARHDRKGFGWQQCNRQTDIKTDRKTEKQTDRQTDRQKTWLA